ncbi:centrosomal protein of 72 kDa-like [Argonauta hians]
MALVLTEEIIRERVNLAHNNLEDVKCLSLPGSYQDKFSSVGKSLRKFSRLKVLDLSRNTLTSLSGLDHLQLLEKLNLYYNNISSIEELKPLKKNQNLLELDLRLNPVTRNDPDYRLYLIHLLPNLQKLDDRCIRDRERHSAHLHFSEESSGFATELELRQEGNINNNRAHYVKSLTCGKVFSEDIGILDILDPTQTKFPQPQHLSGSVATNPSVEEYSAEALKLMKLNDGAGSEAKPATDPNFRKSSENGTNSDKHKSLNDAVIFEDSTNNDTKRQIYPAKFTVPVSHKQEVEAFSKYLGHCTFTPQPGNTSGTIDLHQEQQNAQQQQQHQSKKYQTLKSVTPRSSFSERSESSKNPDVATIDRLLLKIMDLVDKYWNGAQSLHRNMKFKSIAKSFIEKHWAQNQEGSLSLPQFSSNKLKADFTDKVSLKTQLEQCLEENKKLRNDLQDLMVNKSKQSTEVSATDLEGKNVELENNVKRLQLKLEQGHQVHTLADMLQDSHKSLIQTNQHLLQELEESKHRHQKEVQQLQWNYDQLRQTLSTLDSITEPTERGLPFSLVAENMAKSTAKLYDSDEKESLFSENIS